MSEDFYVREPHNARKLHIFDGDGPMAQSLCDKWVGGSVITEVPEDAESRDDLPLHEYDPGICKKCKRKKGLIDKWILY